MIAKLKSHAGAAALILLGIAARFHRLAWHFTHIDDLGPAKTLIDAHRSGASPWFAVPFSWTCAPAQFFLTSLLLNTSQTYREVLFRARLPSCLAAAAGLILFAVLLYRLYGKRWTPGILALAILCFSFEDVIYAQQISNYALGVTACIFMMLMAFHLFRREPATGLKCRFMTAALLALLGACHYQMLFFAPAFLGALLIHDLERKVPLSRALTLALVSGLTFAALAFPLWHYFLKQHTGAGLTGWNAGPVGEYALSFTDMNLAAKIAAAISFFIQNYPVVMTTLTGFAAETSPLTSILCSVLFPVLSVAGLARMVLGKDKLLRPMGFLILFSLGITVLLVAAGKLTFSPTRHLLILLPLLALATGEGLNLVTHWLVRRLPAPGTLFPRILPWIFASILAIAFTLELPAFYREREDPFREEDIVSALRLFNVDALIRVHHTLQPSLMKSVTDYFGEQEKGWEIHGVLSKGNGSDRTLAWISHRDRLTPGGFEQFRRMISLFAGATNAQRVREGLNPLPVLADGLEKYHVVYQKEVISDREVEYSRRTRNGSNQLFFYILTK